MKALDFLVNLKQSRDFDGNLESSLDEAIAELEEMQQSKSCEGCKYGVFESKIKYVSAMDEQLECCLVCVRNCNDYFEPKEQ